MLQIVVTDLKRVNAQIVSNSYILGKAWIQDVKSSLNHQSAEKSIRNTCTFGKFGKYQTSIKMYILR